MDQRLGHDEVSLDAPVGEDDDRPPARDRILPSSGCPAADERLGNEELQGSCSGTSSPSSPRRSTSKERYIFEKRLIADEPLTLQDIGTHFGVSRERARQIEAALIDRMREYMRSEMPDFDLVAEPKP